MSQWMGDLAHDYLKGIYDSIHESLLNETYLQADETPIDYLQPGNGSVKKGYLWTISRPDSKTHHPKYKETLDTRRSTIYRHPSV